MRRGVIPTLPGGWLAPSARAARNGRATGGLSSGGGTSFGPVLDSVIRATEEGDVAAALARAAPRGSVPGHIGSGLGGLLTPDNVLAAAAQFVPGPIGEAAQALQTARAAIALARRAFQARLSGSQYRDIRPGQPLLASAWHVSRECEGGDGEYFDGEFGCQRVHLGSTPEADLTQYPGIHSGITECFKIIPPTLFVDHGVSRNWEPDVDAQPEQVHLGPGARPVEDGQPGGGPALWRGPDRLPRSGSAPDPAPDSRVERSGRPDFRRVWLVREGSQLTAVLPPPNFGEPPPRGRFREAKFAGGRAAQMFAALIGFNAVTEVRDWIRSMWKNIPPDRRDYWAKGKTMPSFPRMLQDVFNHFGDIQWGPWQWTGDKGQVVNGHGAAWDMGVDALQDLFFGVAGIAGAIGARTSGLNYSPNRAALGGYSGYSDLRGKDPVTAAADAAFSPGYVTPTQLRQVGPVPGPKSGRKKRK